MLSPLLLNCTSSPAITIPPDSWLLVTHSMEHKFPPYLANGYLAATIPPEGTGWTDGKCPASYISGVYNGVLLNPPHLANIPYWSAIVFNNGDADYKKGLGEHLDYTQTLDMRRGLINTKETWIERNKKTDIDIAIFISRDKMYLACIRYDVTPHYSGPVSFRTFLDGRDSEDVYQLDQGVDPNKHLFWLVTETLKPEIGWLPKVKIAQASLSVFSKNFLPQIKYHSNSIHAILAAQLGQREILGKYFRDSYQHNINPPFYVWSESPGSSAINFHTGAGGFLQAVINGLAGVRIHQDKLMVNPLLPEGIDGLYIKGIHYGPWVYNLHIRPQRKLSVKKTWKPLWKLMQKIKYAF